MCQLGRNSLLCGLPTPLLNVYLFLVFCTIRNTSLFSVQYTTLLYSHSRKQLLVTLVDCDMVSLEAGHLGC